MSLTRYKAYVHVPVSAEASTVEQVVSLQETVQRTEDHRRNHDVQRTRPTFVQQRVNKRPGGTENKRGEITRGDYSLK